MVVDLPCYRSASRDAIGSGFFIEGGAEGVVAVTNAHVVHGHRVVGLEWVDGPEMGGCSAELIAIDYGHDLGHREALYADVATSKLAGAVLQVNRSGSAVTHTVSILLGWLRLSSLGMTLRRVRT